MTLNSSIRYYQNELYCDDVAISSIIEETGTPVYIYSLKRALANFNTIRNAFTGEDVHIHFSAKANNNLSIMRTLIEEGAGIDAVSGGEIFKALKAGIDPRHIVFAGVGKTSEEIRYAIESGVGWFNIENEDECRIINEIAGEGSHHQPVRAALRLNPGVTANTHPYMATGHGGAKFGLSAESIRTILSRQDEYPNINFAGIHVHIGSQLGDTEATREAVEIALELLAPYENLRTLNMGGGLPVSYKMGEQTPSIQAFVDMLKPHLPGYRLLLEPGRSIIADAGILVTKILYVKKHAGQIFYITDASMTELIRPPLYKAHHEIVPIKDYSGSPLHNSHVVGPVCETADVMGYDRQLPELQPGDYLAILTAGAYGMTMASNYNARTRPPEIVVSKDGQSWITSRRRENWQNLIEREI